MNWLLLLCKSVQRVKGMVAFTLRPNSLITYVALDGFNKQENESCEMHYGKTWISSLDKA